MERIQVFAILASAAVCIVIVELVRKKKLMEKYSLIWIFSTVILITLSLWRNFLERLADFLGIYYAPTALFIVLSFCGLGLLIHFSIAISTLTEQNKILAQEVALLKNEVQTINESEAPESKNVRYKRTSNEQE
ncbi:DUF2304 domain-containing protein [candidate division KSB1 bacterium]|nr:DUF2304 domain-containing protein [candidate division KSB1 bacterium]TDI91510.1 MAG: DUF2304 domain-containing protein [Caldithrix sp.]TDI92955.1 MAG: DUF2304 domain-containing protein [Caldithrix sp.]